MGTGAERWRWSGSSPAYASPVVLVVGGEKLVFAQTEATQVAVKAADGKVVWESAAAGAGEAGGGGPGGRGGGRGGGGRDYKATTPAVDGAMFVLTGRGNKAVKFERTGDGFAARELWSNSEKPAQFASPVLKDGLVIGFSAANEFFCLDARDGALLWSAQLPSPEEGQAAPAGERPAGQEGARGPAGPGGEVGRVGRVDEWGRWLWEPGGRGTGGLGVDSQCGAHRVRSPAGSVLKGWPATRWRSRRPMRIRWFRGTGFRQGPGGGDALGDRVARWASA
ncbi:MAG: PQQ-binding-like beta-propeller repeat protein [Verrucomicrobia bacterium]|nr:PQQ-binding-like beta-propeller repeat protein [Verrucomicrobiota bacterium]